MTNIPVPPADRTWTEVPQAEATHLRDRDGDYWQRRDNDRWTLLQTNGNLRSDRYQNFPFVSLRDWRPFRFLVETPPATAPETVRAPRTDAPVPLADRVWTDVPRERATHVIDRDGDYWQAQDGDNWQMLRPSGRPFSNETYQPRSLTYIENNYPVRRYLTEILTVPVVTTVDRSPVDQRHPPVGGVWLDRNANTWTRQPAHPTTWRCSETVRADRDWHHVWDNYGPLVQD